MPRFLLALLLVILPTVAQAQWYEATSEHFTVYSERSQDEVTRLTTTLERYDALLRLLSGTPKRITTPAMRVTVYELPNMGAMTKLTGSASVAGFYIPRAGGSAAFVPVVTGEKSSDFSNAVLLHEYAHHFMYLNFPIGYPSWFIEGFAEFNGTTTFAKDGTATIGNSAKYRAGPASGAVSLERMLTDEKPITGMDVFELYSRAWIATHFFTFAENRKGQLDKYLKLVAAGTARAKAASEAFGDMSALTRELISYGRSRTYPALKIGPSAFPIGPVKVRRLTAGEAAMMDIHIASTRGVDEAQAKALVPEARRAAVPYPNDPHAQTVLAEAEFDAKNFVQAESAADRALAADPKRQRALLYKGQAILARAKKDKSPPPAWKAGRDILLAANRIDPSNPDPMVAYFDSFTDAEEAPSSGAVFGLYHAFKLAPHDASLRRKVARQYLRDGKSADAKTALIPIISGSHTSRTTFGPVMEAIEKSDAPAALAAWDKIDAEAKAKAKGKDGKKDNDDE